MALPLIDTNWPAAERDLKVYLVYPNRCPSLIASSTRPISPSVQLNPDGFPGTFQEATLRLRNETNVPVRLLAIDKAQICSDNINPIPSQVVDSMCQRPTCASITPSFGMGALPTILGPGEELDVLIRPQESIADIGSWLNLIFVMITMDVHDVPGAGSILIPVQVEIIRPS